MPSESPLEQGVLPLAFTESTRRSSDRGHIVDLDSMARGYDARDIELARGVLEAHQVKLSHLYDRLSCLSNSRTRLLPHQIEATHRVANALRPRFILADEVGLGKTIEAGLIIKELMLRKGYSRLLVAVPAPLCVQWQQEMKSKFNEDFIILDRRNFYSVAASWGKHRRIITSIDFIKNPRYAGEILKTVWDIVVFDEAHRLRRDYSKVTQAYSFAEQMSQKCEAFLLLSATPFRGKLEELYYLVRLVDPHLLGPHNSFVQEYILNDVTDGDSSRKLGQLRERIQRVMLRRRKVDVGGFTRRFARTIRFDLSPEERAFYDETTDYVRREYNLALREKNRAVSFIMIVFQKLLDSSTRALLRALEKRKTHLEQSMLGPAMRAAMKQSGVTSIPEDYDPEDLLDESDAPEDMLDNLEEEQRRSLKDLRREIMTLNFLIQLGRKVKIDRKLIKLKETLSRLKKEGRKKFIIFTQFRTTQDYLATQLQPEFTVTLFHGSLSLRAKEEAIEEFRHSTEVLICTEAGGEGRNLQFTNILINYDLPWSPLKIEQRIGRVHRFGQVDDVYIFNFATRDTVAERVLEVLETKIKLFEETIGPPDILLGAMEDEHAFQNSFMQFISGKKTRKEMEAEMEAKLKIAESGYQKLNDLVTPHCVDFNLNDYYEYTRQNRLIDNRELERITLAYLLQNPTGRYRLTRTLDTGGQKNHDVRFAGVPELDADYVLHDTLNNIRRPATFRSDQALENEGHEFLAAGHPLIEESLAYFLKHPRRRCIVFAPELDGRRSGACLIYVCRYLNGMTRAELITCHVSRSGKIEINMEDRLPDIPGSHAHQDRIRIEQRWEKNRLNDIVRNATEVVEQRALQRAEELKENLHSIFKKEEYKLEISYGKKIRQLEEKRDRQQLKCRLEPTPTNRAQLTRIENDLLKSRQEREMRIYRVRREGRVNVELELLQMYLIGS